MKLHCRLLPFLFILFSLSLNVFADDTPSNQNQLLAKIPESVHFLVKNPKNNLIYAATDKNILVVNPSTQTTKKIAVQMTGKPSTLALSPDGKRLYVSQNHLVESWARKIIVVDTETLSALDPIPLPYAISKIQFVNNHFLIAVTTHDDVLQIDTRDSSFKILYDQFNYPLGLRVNGATMMEVSPDQKIVYFADKNFGWNRLLKYDFSHQNNLVLFSMKENEQYKEKDLIEKLKPISLANNEYPILIKQGKNIMIFYKKFSTPPWTISALDFSQYNHLPFPDPDQTTILNENDITNTMREEITRVTNIRFKSNVPYLIYVSEDDFGSNGKSIHLTSKGSYLYYVTASGYKQSYSIPRIRTSDMSVQGSLKTGAYPQMIATSPDEKIAYTYSDSPFVTSIKVWNTENQKQICEYKIKDYFPPTEEINSLMVDDSGEVLLIAASSSLVMLKTGCPDGVVS